MFNFIKKHQIVNRIEDEILYEYIVDEMEAGTKLKGLWAKAYANSEGDNNKIEPLYMQYRVQSIKDYFETLKMAYQKLSKEKISEILNNNQSFKLNADEYNKTKSNSNFDKTTKQPKKNQ